MTEKVTPTNTPESAPPKTAEPHAVPVKHRLQNLDRGSTVAFVSAAVLGAVGVANNVRYTFWHNFIQGFNEINTPFAPVRDKYQAMFKKTAADKSASRITAHEYRDSMRNIADNYRNEVAEKLLKDFDIPTHGVKGWTVGTVKRMKELGINGRIQSIVGFATVGAIAFGAMNVLRSSKNTIDRIEDKIDAGHHSR